MITDRNKLNFVTIQWLVLCIFGLILACSGSDSNSNTNINSNSNALLHNVETTSQQQRLQQQQQQQAQAQSQSQQNQKPTLTLVQAQTQAQQSALQRQVESNGPPSPLQQQDVTVRNFSPRMDYNNHEWRPVGRGDPLKNDPTFDYSPPTLDRVRYWADPDKDKEKIEDVPATIIDAKLKMANPGKNEILLLGVTGDRLRGAPAVQHAPSHTLSVMKNAKGETPLLQPKYTSIRRSYYSHQLPTHLMPPPMQPVMPALQQQPSMQQQQQQMHQQMLVQHMSKPVHSEYRHNGMVGGAQSYMNSPAMSNAMNGHTNAPHHMTVSTHQPWMHSQSSIATSMPSQHMKPAHMMGQQHFSHNSPYDSHHQESVNYVSYTRPSMMSSTPAVVSGNHEYYSPNSIRGSASIHKPATSSRKPWLHDLLKKEFIKPQKPTVSPNSYHTETSKAPQVEASYHNPYQTEVSKPTRMEINYHNSHITETTRPSQIETKYHNAYHMDITKSPAHQMDTNYHNSYHADTSRPLQMDNHLTLNYHHTEAPKSPHMETHFEPMLSAPPPRASSTTYAPVSFMTITTTAAPTQAAVYITSSTSTSTTAAPPTRTTTTLSPTRLLIPNTSNLAYRPTVTPMKMTTDSLFSHYNQPETPLKGPMYLIIEGHSKVKTYGKDELDPHKPKIVPVISKREPVVRIADPNEKRGTPETFQVKHLHTKTTSAAEKTTTAKPATKTTPSTTPTTTTSTKKPMTTTRTTTTTTTTKKPTVKAKMNPSTSSPPKPTKPTPQTTKKPKPIMATTSAKPLTSPTKPVPKLSVTTKKTTTTTTTTTPKPKTLSKDSIKSPLKSEKLRPNNVNLLDVAAKPTLGFPTQPPTGMQGLLSLLGSSLDTFLQDDYTAPTTAAAEKKDTITKLKPMKPETEARVSTKLQAIKAEDYPDEDEQLRKVTTEYLPRETRQIFDYDQLPESRIGADKDKDKDQNSMNNYEDIIANLDDEDGLSALDFDEEYEDDEESELAPSNPQQLIKRIDSLVNSNEDLEDLEDEDDDDGDDDQDDDADALTALGDDGLDVLSLARQQKSSPKKA